MAIKNFTKVEDIKDNKSIVKKGSTNGKTTVTKPGGEEKKTTATPDPAKLASQANTSMSGSNVEFGQGVKNLASRIDRNQAGRRSMKQETTKRIQEGDFTHGYAKLPSDVKKDNGALLGKYDRKMLKASNRQKNKLNKAAAKLGLQVTNSTKNNTSSAIIKEKSSNGNAVVNGKILDANGNTKDSASAIVGNTTSTSMKDIVKNTKNKVGPGSGENPRGDGSKIDSNIKVKPAQAGGGAGPEDLQKAENKANTEFLKHEGKHLKVGEDYMPSNKNKTNSIKPTSSVNSKSTTTSNQSNVNFFEIYKKEKLWDKDNLANYFKQNPIKK